MSIPAVHLRCTNTEYKVNSSIMVAGDDKRLDIDDDALAIVILYYRAKPDAPAIRVTNNKVADPPNPIATGKWKDIKAAIKLVPHVPGFYSVVVTALSLDTSKRPVAISTCQSKLIKVVV